MNLAFAVILASSGLVGMWLLLWRLFRCDHAWELVDKTEFPSPIEVFKQTGVEYPAVWPSQVIRMTARTIVLVIRCPKCGTAKIRRESGTL